MMRSRRLSAASGITFAVAISIVAACVPQPGGRRTPGPTDAGTAGPPPATAPPTPGPTGPTASPSFVRPTPTPLPTFLPYVVQPGDTLTSIARAHRTTARSIAFWNRTTYPSLDPDSPDYAPNRIEVGWVLLLVPDIEIDEDETFPD